MTMAMKFFFVFALTILISTNPRAETPDEDRFAFNHKLVISLFGGGAEIIGASRSLYPVVNPTFGYHLSDRFNIVADAFFTPMGRKKLNKGQRI